METNKIYNLDCSELFKRMKDENILVDAIITDPPYDLDLVNKENFSSSVLKEWNDDYDQLVWIRESAPLVKEGGSVIIFNHWRNLNEISQELERNNLVVKELIRWVKPNPLWKNFTERYTTDYELAIWAVKGENWTFNFEKQLINNLKNKKSPCLIPEYVGGVVFGEERIHPTQKNLQVMKDIIELHTNSNDLILDPFMGSGTTAVACQELGRNFIGSEINKEYFQKAEMRLEKLDFRKIKESYLEVKHELNKDDLQTLIEETEAYIKELSKEINANKVINYKEDDYEMLSKRLIAKEKIRDELKEVLQQWKIKLVNVIYESHQSYQVESKK